MKLVRITYRFNLNFECDNKHPYQHPTAVGSPFLISPFFICSQAQLQLPVALEHLSFQSYHLWNCHSKNYPTFLVPYNAEQTQVLSSWSFSPSWTYQLLVPSSVLPPRAAAPASPPLEHPAKGCLDGFQVDFSDS